MATQDSEFFQNVDRASEIAKTLYYQFKNRTGFFEGYSMPEYELPTGLSKASREYALYLTYVIAIDYQTDAVKLWSRARSLYEKEPELFEPETIVSLDRNYLTSVTRSLGARYPANGADGWKRISEILLRQYGGDPRHITNVPLSLSELRRRLQAFPYLRGKKLINFYMRAMGEDGLFRITDFDELSVAVDIQVARVTFYTGVLRVNGSYSGCIHHEPIRPLIEEVWSRAAKKISVPAWYLDEPLWSVGSKLCSKNNCTRCPVEGLCAKKFEVRFNGANIQV